jgi:hypothetical protein
MHAPCFNDPAGMPSPDKHNCWRLNVIEALTEAPAADSSRSLRMDYTGTDIGQDSF